MNQKRRAPTLTFKAITGGAPVGTLEVVRESVSAAPEALEWALDVELEAFREALPRAHQAGAPDSVESANYAHHSLDHVERGPREESASISSALLAQVAMTQNGPRAQRSPAWPSSVSQDALPARYEVSGDAFDVDERVSRLIEARGTATPLKGRSETSSFPGLHAFESYEAPAEFMTEQQSLQQTGEVAPSDAGVGQYDSSTWGVVDYTPPVTPRVERAVSGQYQAVSGSYHIVSGMMPSESPEDLFRGDASVQQLPSQAERRAKLSQPQVALSTPRKRRAQLLLCASSAAAIGLSVACFHFFGLL